MNDRKLIFNDIQSISHPLFFQWLDLYETAFPPNEKLLISSILKLIEESGKDGAHHFIAITDENGQFAGIMFYDTDPENRLALLWYLAIQPERRSQGLGSAVYQGCISRLDTSSYDALIYEVEIPKNKNRAEAERRISFYKRNGAFLLGGIHYLQIIGWHHPPTPMHLMVHPLREIDAKQAFALAKIPFGDALQKRGKLTLK